MNTVGLGCVTGSITSLLLCNASIGVAERFGDIFNTVGLELTTSRSVGRKIVVGDALDQGIKLTTTYSVI